MTRPSNPAPLSNIDAVGAKPFNPNDHLMTLTGKQYLPVAARVAWINKEFGHEFTLTTELLKLREYQEEDPRKSKPNAPVMRNVSEAIFRATVRFPNGHEVTAHGSETSTGFGEWLEKAETKAIGRALGYAGYGTMFAPEFDEADTIARREAIRDGRDVSENTYENTGAVDAAVDLSKFKKEAAPSNPEPQTPATQTPAPAPAATSTGTPSQPQPAAQPVKRTYVEADREKLADALGRILSKARASEESVKVAVENSITGAIQAHKAPRAGLLPIQVLGDLVETTGAMLPQVSAA